MNGPYADEYGSGGQDEGSAGLGTWLVLQQSDDAREELAEAPEGSTLMELLLTSEGGGVR